MKRSNRGTIVIEALIVTAAIGVAAKLAGWKPLAIFAKQPPTAQLTQVQADLAAAQAREAAALAKLHEAEARQEAAKQEQLRYGQGAGLAAQTALETIPVEERVPAVKLAVELVGRVNNSFESALGKLPPEQQQFWRNIVAQSISARESEVAALRAALAERDAQFAAARREAAALAAQVPQLKSEVEVAHAATTVVQAKADTLVGKVSEWAAKHAELEKRDGSLSSALDRLLFWAAVLVGGYLFLAYILPGLIKHLDDGPLKRGLRNVAGYATSGLLFHDAKKKLSALNSQLSSPPQ